MVSKVLRAMLEDCDCLSFRGAQLFAPGKAQVDGLRDRPPGGPLFLPAPSILARRVLFPRGDLCAEGTPSLLYPELPGDLG